MSAPKIGSLFSGYGGLDMAVEAVTGATTAWVSDIDKGACKILAHRYPDAPNLGDITKVDWTAVEPVDIITGGFPCTDVSSGGNKKGIQDGEFSGLWTEMARAVRELRPPLVVVENVRDLLARGLDIVLGDLARIGYDARWMCVPAYAVGAPYGRPRLFIAASPTGSHFYRQERVSQLNSGAPQGVPERPEWYRRHADRLAVETRRALDRWAELLGRPAPDPSDALGANGQPRINPRFSEWLMGLPEGWVTDVPDLDRMGQMMTLGNGVVPQQAIASLTTLLPVEARAAA